MKSLRGFSWCAYRRPSFCSFGLVATRNHPLFPRRLRYARAVALPNFMEVDLRGLVTVVGGRLRPAPSLRQRFRRQRRRPRLDRAYHRGWYRLRSSRVRPAAGYRRRQCNVYHFTTIDIPAGVTVKMAGPMLNMRPVYWLASGDVNIGGVIDLDGEDGALANTHRLSMPGPGGYPGGAQAIEAEGVGTIAEQLALGPGAGVHAQYPGGAGHAVRGGGNSNYGTLGRAYGNELLIPLLGGSGGSPSGSQGGGGAGGGALLIASSTSIALNGVISARGGKGGRKLSGTLGGGEEAGAPFTSKRPRLQVRAPSTSLEANQLFRHPGSV